MPGREEPRATPAALPSASELLARPPIACSALLPSSFLLVLQKRKVEGLEDTQDIQNQRNSRDPRYTSAAAKGSKGG